MCVSEGQVSRQPRCSPSISSYLNSGTPLLPCHIVLETIFCGNFWRPKISSPKYRANRIPKTLRLKRPNKRGGGRIWNQQERGGAIPSTRKAGGRSERAQEIKPKSKNSTRLMVTGGVRLRHQENMSDSLTLDNYVKVCVTTRHTYV